MSYLKVNCYIVDFYGHVINFSHKCHVILVKISVHKTNSVLVFIFCFIMTKNYMNTKAVKIDLRITS